MHHQNTVFHALLKVLPRHRFERLVAAHEADRRVRRLPCWSQFVAMLYAQLSGARSLRELEGSLASHDNLFYHLGLGPVCRSTLSDANRERPASLYEDVFATLLETAQGRLGQDAATLVRLLDASPLALSRNLCAWARFSDQWTAAKLHVVYDPQARLPTYFTITPAKINDIVEAKAMPIEAGATYVFDRGYYSFDFWAKLNDAGCRFVTRLKDNSPTRQIEARPAEGEGIVSDRVVELNRRMARSRRNPYCAPLREIIVERDNGHRLRLVSNDLEAPASEIAELYKTRWQIELFFKWVKQNLKIKSFLGTSPNAVKIQIITALIAYLLIHIVQQSFPIGHSMQQLARLIRANLMHRKTIEELLKPPPKRPNRRQQSKRQFSFQFQPINA